MKGNSMLAAQLVGGALTGYVFYLIGGAIGVVVSCPHGGIYESWWKVCIWGLTAFLIGVSTGVYLFGKVFKQEGSLGFTILGSVLGGAAVYAFLVSPERFAACALVSLLSPLLATLGFHLRRPSHLPQT